MSGTKPPDDGPSDPSEPPKSRTGEQVDKYRIERRLGAGGMGEVYEAVRTEMIHNRVALKLLYPGFSKRPANRARFEREARILSQLEHPGIVRIVDFGVSENGEAFLAMEFLRGESLDQRLAKSQGFRLSVDSTVQLGFQVADALASAHQAAVIHRDIKPSNLMLVPEEAVMGRERVKVVDFGIALDIEGNREALTGVGGAPGTNAYMSPEQWRGDDVNSASDVFSLGLVFYECIAGQAAFTGNGEVRKEQVLTSHPVPLHHLQPKVPRLLSDLVARMLAKAPGQRPTMRIVKEVLETLIPARPPSVKVQALGNKRWYQNRWLRWSVLPLLLGAVVVGMRWCLAESAPFQCVANGSLLTCSGGAFWMGSTPEEVAVASALCEKQSQTCRAQCEKHDPACLHRCTEQGLECRPDMFARETPRRSVFLSPFSTDLRLVTVGDYLRYLERKGPSVRLKADSAGEPRYVMGGETMLFDLEGSNILYKVGRFSAKPGTEQFPVDQITWNGAMAYCQFMGKRLLTEAQWEAAARWQAESKTSIGPSSSVQLPASIGEWVFDEFKDHYEPCSNICRNPAVGTGGGQRDSSVVRGCKVGLEASVHCRSAARVPAATGVGNVGIGFRCASY